RYNELIIQEGVGGSLRADIREVESNLGSVLSQTESELSSTRQILSEIVRSETLHRLESSVQEEQRMGEILWSSHNIHAGMFIVELVLFAELFEGIMETLPIFDHLRESGATGQILLYHSIAILFGIICAIILTRIAAKTKLARALFAVEDDHKRK
ncbi:hypothetical protein ACFLRC_03725, partial [Candidatus Altiarchaeota archaeon]